jgi:hypothetical protein
MLPSRIDDYEELLTHNSIWESRTRGIGVLEAKDAIALGVSGPMLRAAGVDYDVRKYFPYSSYEEFDFNVPTRTEADCYARYLVRLAEMRESLKIVRQAMNKIPAEGPIRADVPGIIPPQREEMKTDMEALIYHFKIFTEGFAPPPGEVYQRIESPRGELGFFVASDGSAKPCRVKVRAPSFVNLQSLPKLSEGGLVADSDRLHRNDRYRTRRSGPLMELPPALEQKFQTLLRRYPVKRSALVPMALYGQDAFGFVSDDLIAEISRRLDLNTLQVRETLGYYSMIRRKHCRQISRSGVYERILHVARRE